MRMLLISLAGQVLLNALFLLCVWWATKKGSQWRRIAIGWVVFELLYFLVIVISKVLYHSRGEYLRVGTSLFTNYYVFIVILMMPLLCGYFIIWLLGKLNVVKQAELRLKLRSWLLIVLLPITGALCIKGYYNSINPVATHSHITLPYNGAPKELKIAFITDLDIGELVKKEVLQKMVKMVQEEQPDYVLVGGDQVDYYFDYVERDPEISELLLSLHSDKSRIFHVLGNHEYYIDNEPKRKWLNEVGTLLVDSVVQLSDSLYLIGRDDAYNESNRLPLKSLVEQVPEGATTILLDHQPIEPDVERALGIDLALHGHTHDGQFIPFMWLVWLNFENSYGYLHRGVTHYITSSGLGFSSSPILLGTLSEVVIIHLKLQGEK